MRDNLMFLILKPTEKEFFGFVCLHCFLLISYQLCFAYFVSLSSASSRSDIPFNWLEKTLQKKSVSLFTFFRRALQKTWANSRGLFDHTSAVKFALTPAQTDLVATLPTPHFHHIRPIRSSGQRQRHKNFVPRSEQHKLFGTVLFALLLRLLLHVVGSSCVKQCKFFPQVTFVLWLIDGRALASSSSSSRWLPAPPLPIGRCLLPLLKGL